MAAMPPAPVVLEGRFLRLEPLSLRHVPDLYLGGGHDDEVWRWLPVVTPRSEREMRSLVEQRLAQQAAGGALLFAVVPRGTYRAAGWTAYVDVSVSDECLGIGWSWLGRPLWATPVRLEMNLMTADHAFRGLGFGRVQWQVDHDDLRTRDAVLSLGATREGTLRRNVRRPDGTWRDTVLFSLLASEWGRAREHALASLRLG
ncbi:GNAT family N-acetyltransferase [Streptomyces sp. HB2AG]|uniref:GNAT family N-acetyltransferase n=1 Tax=Streptomyces sp. HB2AG TaxID=2983400 RepID=UPI0022AB2E2F|nr:GNAT family protein [Streptomyces sp. HB2AG]MCZ2524887.1 GNAT family protein [Streptomyces sp. HB2AG]